MMKATAKSFIRDMLERAIKTAAQTTVATIGASSTVGDVSWGIVASTTTLATLLSILTSIASFNIGETGTASVVNEL